MIDSLSFEPHEDGTPWVAYRQFCEHFLAPLALMARRDVRLAALLRADPDGVPLDLAKGLLPWRTRLNFGLLSHLHLHANAQVRHAADDDDGRRPDGRGSAARSSSRSSRTCATRSAALDWKPGGTEWSDYADNTSLQRPRDRRPRNAWSASSSRQVPGARAWDLGRQHGPLQPDRRRRRQARPRVRHRPGGRRAQLPPDPERGEGRHPAPDPRRREPEPGHRLGQPRAPLAARAGRPRRHPRARAGPPPRDLAQRAAADAARPVRRHGAVGDRRVRAQGGPDGPPPARDAAGRLPDYTLDGFRPRRGSAGRSRPSRPSRTARAPSSCSRGASGDLGGIDRRVTARRALPSDPREFARSAVPIGLIVLAAAVPLDPPVRARSALVAGVASRSGATRRSAGPGRPRSRSRSACAGACSWPRSADPGGADCTSLGSPPAVWRLTEAVLVLGVLALLATVLRARRSDLYLRWPARSVVQLGGRRGDRARAARAAARRRGSRGRSSGRSRSTSRTSASSLPALVFAAANGVMEELAYRGAMLAWTGPGHRRLGGARRPGGRVRAGARQRVGRRRLADRADGRARGRRPARGAHRAPDALAARADRLARRARPAAVRVPGPVGRPDRAKRAGSCHHRGHDPAVRPGPDRCRRGRPPGARASAACRGLACGATCDRSSCRSRSPSSGC